MVARGISDIAVCLYRPHRYPLTSICSTVSNLHIDNGLALFYRYGSNVRVSLDLLNKPEKEETYVRDIQSAASKFARDFTKSIHDILDLDYSSREVSSKIFTLRPKSLESRQIAALGIPTTFLLKSLALALARDPMAEQDVIFTTLNSHPTLRSPAGWMFEHTAPVFACVMQFGVFNEQKLQQLSDVIDDVSKQ